MKINDIKENRKFQIIVCIIVGFLMVWGQIYLEKEDKKMLKELDEDIEKIENDMKNLLDQLHSI